MDLLLTRSFRIKQFFSHYQIKEGSVHSRLIFNNFLKTENITWNSHEMGVRAICYRLRNSRPGTRSKRKIWRVTLHHLIGKTLAFHMKLLLSLFGALSQWSWYENWQKMRPCICPNQACITASVSKGWKVTVQKMEASTCPDQNAKRSGKCTADRRLMPLAPLTCLWMLEGSVKAK